MLHGKVHVYRSKEPKSKLAFWVRSRGCYIGHLFGIWFYAKMVSRSGYFSLSGSCTIQDNRAILYVVCSTMCDLLCNSNRDLAVRKKVSQQHNKYGEGSK